MRLTDRKVVRKMFAGVLLPKIAGWKISSFDPIGDQLRSAIVRTVVDHDPFEITQCLRAQAVVYSTKRVRPIVGGGEHGEQNGMGHRLVATGFGARKIRVCSLLPYPHPHQSVQDRAEETKFDDKLDRSLVARRAAR